MGIHMPFGCGGKLSRLTKAIRSDVFVCSAAVTDSPRDRSRSYTRHMALFFDGK